MPMVRLYVNKANAVEVRDPEFKRGVRTVIADNLSVDGITLNPDDDIDVRVIESAAGSHSKYDLTVDIEAMDTPSRSEDLPNYAKYIRLGLLEIVGSTLTINVWFKLVKASYAPES